MKYLKKDDRGFAASSLLYGLIIVLTLIISVLMGTMSSNRRNSSKLVKEIEAELNRYSETKTSFKFLPNSQEYIVPNGQSGWYKIELWGASGGKGAKGAYTSGITYFSENAHIYFYVGEEGRANCANTLFNGGGQARSCGGGATDVRLISGSWNEISSLTSRLMVAAGGGSENNAASTGKEFPYRNTLERLGFGVNGGGGGYYGGRDGNGGSSYISGYGGSNTSTASSLTYRTKHDIGMYFKNGIIIPNTNSGPGRATIEKISSNDQYHPPLVKNTNVLDNVKTIKEEIITDGNISGNDAIWSEIQGLLDGNNVIKDAISNVSYSSSIPYNSKTIDGDTEHYNNNDEVSAINNHHKLEISVTLNSPMKLDEIVFFHSEQLKQVNAFSKVTVCSSSACNVVLENVNNKVNDEVRFQTSKIENMYPPNGTYYLQPEGLQNQILYLSPTDGHNITASNLTNERLSQWVIQGKYIVNNETKNTLQHTGDNIQEPGNNSRVESITKPAGNDWEEWTFLPQKNGSYVIMSDSTYPSHQKYCLAINDAKRATVKKCDTNDIRQQFKII